MENQQPSQISNGPQESTQSIRLSLGEILSSLAEVFRYPLTDRAERAYVHTVGHRTDKDLNDAYRTVLRDFKRMPTPSELLEACGILRVRRDGTRPE